MQENIQLFLRAIILAIAVESLIWTLFPALMRKIMLRFLAEPDNSLRAAGLSGLVLAALMAFFVTFLNK